jgi:hypothetical protein
MKIRTKSYIEKLLPELKPNSEPMLMGIASAPILQNPMLVAVYLAGVFYVLNNVIAFFSIFYEIF